MPKSSVTAPSAANFISIEFSVVVHPSSYRYSSPQGSACFNVTLPISTVGSFSLDALVKPLIEDAKINLAQAIAQAEAEAKAKEEAGE